MYRKRLLIALFTALIVVSSTTFAVSPSDSFNRGKSLLSGGDLRGALLAYADAVRGDRANQVYLQEFMLVRRALVLEQTLAEEKDTRRWLPAAQAMRAFYVEKGLLPQALEIDTQIHARQKTAFSAMQLAEIQLALKMDGDAERVLSGLDPQKVTPASQALLAVAMARQGKSAEAEQIAKVTALSSDRGPGALYSVARMHAAVGNNKHSLSTLVRCFEATPPSQLSGLKSHARQCPEFASMASTAEFHKALQTESKIPESKCSGGSSCAGCPMRAKCASAGQ